MDKIEIIEYLESDVISIFVFVLWSLDFESLGVG